MSMPPSPPADSAPRAPRLLSLDALRGFDMLWIIGGDALVRALARWQKIPWLETWAKQLSHVRWEGLQAYDLIFPLFMFLSGLAIPLSLESRLDRGDSKLRLWGKILTRVCLLVFLGAVYNGLLSADPKEPRLASVLGQIGIAWGIAASVHLVVRGAWQRVAILAGLFALIAGLQLLTPVPGHGAGVLTREGAINTWLDRSFLPGRLLGGTFDPEGLLCILSASSLTLAGALAGSPLRKATSHGFKFVGWQVLAGAGFVAAGALCWKLGYPPIKALWTVTFDFLAIGISLLVFALFHLVIDVIGLKAWSFPLRVIGMNPLTIYLAARFISFDDPAGLLFGRLARVSGDAGSVILAAGVLVLEWLLLFFLYRKKWFLRI